MKVYLEAKVISNIPNNHFKGLNLKKEIVNFRKRVEFIKTEEPRDSYKFFATKGYIKHDKTNNPLLCTNANEKVSLYNKNFISTSVNRKQTDNNSIYNLLESETKVKITPNFNQYKAFLHLQKKKSMEEKIQQRRGHSVLYQETTRNENKEEINEKVVRKIKENMIFYKDAPSSGSFYTKLSRKRDDIIKQIYDKINSNHDILYSYNKEIDPSEKDKFIKINKKLPSLIEKKKEDKDKDIFSTTPIPYIPDIAFDSYSEASRYEKYLQMLLILQSEIRKEPNSTNSILRNFLFKQGFNVSKIPSEEIINLNYYLNDNSLYINPKLSFKDNLNLVLKGAYRPLSMNSSNYDNFEIKKSQEKAMSILNEYNENINIKPKTEREVVGSGQAIINSKNKKMVYTFYNNSNQPVNNAKKTKRKSSSIGEKFKTSINFASHKLYKEDDKKDINNLITEIEDDFRRENLEVNLNEKYVVDKDYLDPNRLYLKSIKPIPQREEANKLLLKIDKNSFIKKKKLLEYVILKEYKNNSYYVEEAAKLENDVKKKLTKKKFKLKFKK